MVLFIFVLQIHGRRPRISIQTIHGGVEFYTLKERKDIPIEYQKIAIEEGYKRLVEWFGTEPVVFVPTGFFSSNTSKILKEFGYRYYFDGFSFKKLQKEKYINLNFIPGIPVKDLEWGVYPSYKRVFAKIIYHIQRS